MSIKRQTRETIIETHKTTIIRTSGISPTTHCECCLKTVSVFAPEQIAVILQIDLTEVCHRIETGELHLTGISRGTARICGSFFQNKSNLAEIKKIKKGEI